MARSDGTLDPHQKEIAKLMRANAHRHRPHRVFADFCELAAISLSNAADRLHQAKREARYLEIVKQYEPDEVARFPAMLAHGLTTRAERQAITDAVEMTRSHVDLASSFVASLGPARRPRRSRKISAA